MRPVATAPSLAARVAVALAVVGAWSAAAGVGGAADAAGTAGAAGIGSAAVGARAEQPLPAVAAGRPADAGEGAILAVYPNPVAAGDAGEYVLVRRSAGGNWTLDDGETVVRVPSRPPGAVVVSPDPGAVPDGLDRPVVEASGDLALANGGETIRLRRGSRTVDRVTYEDAPEGEVLHVGGRRWRGGERADTGGEGTVAGGERIGEGSERIGWGSEPASTGNERPGADGGRSGPDGEWRPLGASDRAVARAGPASVEAFVLPDARSVPAETLAGADRRVLLAGYTLASWRVARRLAAARERGAAVRVLVDGAPVGGLSRRSAALLDWLVAGGVEVRVVGGPYARYDYHHAKYAVVDDRALVTTENWKPSGTGGRSNRGWGVVVRDASVADELASLFRADAGARGAVPWREFREGRSFEPDGAANGSYPRRFAPRSAEAESVRVLVAPDNAERAVVGLVRGADSSVLVEQVSVGGRDQPFLRATLAAARRGVRVRILLSSAWYVAEENRRLADWLNAVAEREGLDLAARLAEPRSRYGTIHAKGVVVDGERAVVGSLNWNNHSARENREVALVLEGEAVAGYYERAFYADWRGGTRRLPLGVLLVVVVAWVGVGLGASRVRFAAANGSADPIR